MQIRTLTPVFMLETRMPDVNAFMEGYIQVICQHGGCGAAIHVLSSLTMTNVFTCWSKASSHHIICVVLEPESAGISQTNAFSCIAVVQLQLVWGNNSFLGVSCKRTEWLAQVEGLFSRNSWAIVELPITWCSAVKNMPIQSSRTHFRHVWGKKLWPFAFKVWDFIGL